jgi:transposase
MVYSFISWKGKGSLKIFKPKKPKKLKKPKKAKKRKKSMNGEDYASYVCKELVPEANLLYKTPNQWILVQDGASIHNCQHTKKRFQEEKVNFLPDWPPNSPDLNPIENIWGIMKTQIAKLGPTTLHALKIAIRKVWRNLDITTIRRILETWVDRLKEVIRVKGEALRH